MGEMELGTSRDLPNRNAIRRFFAAFNAIRIAHMGYAANLRARRQSNFSEFFMTFPDSEILETDQDD